MSDSGIDVVFNCQWRAKLNLISLHCLHSSHNIGPRGVGQTSNAALWHNTNGEGWCSLHGAVVQGGWRRTTVQVWFLIMLYTFLYIIHFNVKNLALKGYQDYFIASVDNSAFMSKTGALKHIYHKTNLASFHALYALYTTIVSMWEVDSSDKQNFGHRRQRLAQEHFFELPRIRLSF